VNVTPPGSPQPAPEGPSDEAPIGVHHARLAINRQIEEAIAALEVIRVDLLRIRSGVGTHDDLESGLTAARQITALGRARPIPSAERPA
jgi:hypothetical protein